MIVDGVQLRKNNDIGWRYAKEGEIDAGGKPYDKHDVVFVRIAECEIKHEMRNGYSRPVYDPKDATPIPLFPRGSASAYSAWEFISEPAWVFCRKKRERTYCPNGHLRCKMYLVHDDRVYIGSIRMTPLDYISSTPHQRVGIWNEFTAKARASTIERAIKAGFVKPVSLEEANVPGVD
jgi:hypothetical protein